MLEPEDVRDKPLRLSLEIEEVLREKEEESTLEVPRGRDTSGDASGVTYQRCGGGRRVIRKQRGGG